MLELSKQAETSFRRRRSDIFFVSHFKKVTVPLGFGSLFLCQLHFSETLRIDFHDIVRVAGLALRQAKDASVEINQIYRSKQV